jgi:hypothetical protein
MSDIIKDPKAFATLLAAGIACLAGLLSLVTSVYLAVRQQRLQKELAVRQEQLQRELADQQGRLQRDIESAKDVFERARSLDAMTRDRIISRFDGALDAFALLSKEAELAGTGVWVREHGSAKIEDRVQSEIWSLRTGLAFLRFMKAMPEPDYERCMTACSKVAWAWEQVMGELALRYGEDLKGNQNAEGEFSSGRFAEWHVELNGATEELGTILFQSLVRIAVPL